MKTQLLLPLLLLLAGALPAQQKGVAPLNPQSLNPQSVIRAVVIGISDYQDPAIPDLQYAHRDAEAFAEWLRSPGGGSVPEDNIILLTNEKATVGRVSLALMNWLIEETREGDRVVIYFSGHGEMEARLLNQLGYLLLWDSPAHVSLAGALPVDILKQVVTTLSIEKNANVLVVADACRAGKLAASNVIGTQLTNANLIKQFAGEQKILSCQADEYSVEGEQWGNGRGVFSFYLVNGLYGMADLDSNGYITLLEIAHYLQNNVTKEVMPVSQIPIVTGDKKATVAKVAAGLLDKIRIGESTPFASFSGIEQRGLVQETLAKTDTSIVELFYAFQKALKEKRFLEPAGNCAEEFYNRLMQEPGIAPLHPYLRRNYAAALMDDGQQILNKYMKTSPSIIDNIWRRQVNWDYIPENMARAAGLLGPTHYYYRSLKAKENFFRYITFSHEKYPSLPADSIPLFLRAFISTGLSYVPDAPYLLLRAARLATFDSLYHYEKRLTEIAPNWAFWYYSIGNLLANHVPLDTLRAYNLLNKSIQLDSDFVEPYWAMSSLLHSLGRSGEVKPLQEKAVEIVRRKAAVDSSSVMAFEWNLTGNLLWQLRRYREAEKALLAGERRLGKPSIIMSSNLHLTYFDMGNFDMTMSTLKRFPEHLYPHWWFRSLGTLFFYYKNDKEKALDYYSKELGVKWFEGMDPAYYWQACLLISIAHRKSGKPSLSWEVLQNLKSTSQELFFEKGEVLLQLGRLSEAALEFDSLLQYLETVEKKGAKDDRNVMFKIIALHRLGRIADLNDAIVEALSEAKNESGFHYNLAVACAQINEPEQAIRHLLMAEHSGWKPSPAQYLFGTVKDPFLDPLRHLPEFQAWEKRWSPPYTDYSKD